MLIDIDRYSQLLATPAPFVNPAPDPLYVGQDRIFCWLVNPTLIAAPFTASLLCAITGEQKGKRRYHEEDVYFYPRIHSNHKIY